MSRIVISDTSPLRYLVLIDQAEVLPSLYTEIFIPEAVAGELRHAATPADVRHWIEHAPSWMRIVRPVGVDDNVSIEGLDLGERDAILLALQLKADLILMDEREGVDEARRLGLMVTGTLGVLDRAAERGLIELAPVIARLRKTNFRIDPVLLQRLLEGDHARRSRLTDD